MGNNSNFLTEIIRLFTPKGTIILYYLKIQNTLVLKTHFLKIQRCAEKFNCSPKLTCSFDITLCTTPRMTTPMNVLVVEVNNRIANSERSSLVTENVNIILLTDAYYGARYVTNKKKELI